ncbi:uncharacterized protein GIQ15_02405 [Arthroderma uncinatum]|uniref:uncharacterized protein n=1 Tax=Arthroderma uncinatum TaxID=74035 RepID=UPI00144A530B|nr:uncharacterized protein GIQ15_02405 [Arthroderma uncinatum]KAF3483081.1 hypothetical protein GIQ15_02405 [Arthroderma uncinatum]
MSQSVPFQRRFDRFTSESELGPMEFEMALDIEEQARISEQRQHHLNDNWDQMNCDFDSNEGNQSNMTMNEETASPLSENNASYLSTSEASRLFPNPEFKFPLEPYHVDFKAADDMDPMKKPTQLQSPSRSCSRRNDQLYTHHRFISEAESYTTHWENSILYDKDTNKRVSTPGYFQSRPKYKSPYLGPVGWTVPSKYYSATTRSSRRATDVITTSRADGGYDDIAAVDPCSGSRRKNIRDRTRETIYNCRTSRPFLIYQDPEWMEPPRGITDPYFDSMASDDKENNEPGEHEAGYDADETGGESFMQLEDDGNDADEDGMDVGDDTATVILSSPSNMARRSRELQRYRHRRNDSSTSSSSIL